MDRFTGRNDAGDLLLFGNIAYGNNQDVYDAVSRLEEYEDTGLSPEEIEQQLCEKEISPEAKYAIDEYADGLIERLDALNKSLDKSTGDGTEELAKAQEEGRVVELPCRPGDAVFVIGKWEIVTCEVLEIKVTSELEHNGRTIFTREKVLCRCGNSPFIFDSCDFGKTVFLTREKAEAALKETEESQ